ncbi:uncharacterized protein KY384_005034 [Bacidia gigantensis]|uniref:uncharacterized protein n=1 Tax=Bacidia gigantensis TaxID=2732470 RepID=UPI001D03C3AB|nr:uncharacterized protein KY384_005034 [Bacidia gigantensis]KAG8530531.1 hypothetical protein KY384_005034 [Bacidia gigantensis]
MTYSASDITASLLKQLCLLGEFLPRCLNEAYSQSGGCPTQLPELGILLRALEETSQELRGPIVIVIDGLDNLPDGKEATDFFRALKYTSWKIILTSRPDQVILEKVCSGCYRKRIQDEDLAGDIRKFVDGSISKNQAFNRMLDDSSNLRQEIIETVTSKSQGLFHWADIQMRLILESINLSGVRSAIHKTPSEISKIVESAFSMVQLQRQHRAWPAMKTIALLAKTRAPLTADAICHAVGLDLLLDIGKNPKRLSVDELPHSAPLIECCAPFVGIDPDTQIVTFAHFDVAQHIQHHYERYFAEERVSLARICLAYLSLNVFSGGPCSDEDSFYRRQRSYPFFIYAAHHWGHHVRDNFSQSSSADGLGDLVIKLLTNRGIFESYLQAAELNFEVMSNIQMRHQLDFDTQLKRLKSVSNLQVAARYGLAETVRILISSDGDSVFQQDLEGMSALHEASRLGWTEIVKILLDAGASPSTTDTRQKTPIHYALAGGHGEISSILEIMMPATPLPLEEILHEAVQSGDIDVVEFLIKQKVNLNPSHIARSALITACRRGHAQIVRLLLESGADPNPRPHECPASEDIPLHLAVRLGLLQIMEILLENGAHASVCDDKGRSALFETPGTPGLETTLMMLQCGINITRKDNDGNKILHWTVGKGALKHTKAFIDQGVPVDSLNNAGLTPLVIAIQNQNYHMVRLLIQRGSDVNFIDDEGRTPLTHAILASKPEICEALLRDGAPAKTDGALGLAIIENKEDILGLLIKYGADINQPDNQSRTPLEVAAAAGQINIVRFLIDAGADVNGHAQQKQTPLTVAIAADHPEIVKVLINKGDPTDCKDDSSEED